MSFIFWESKWKTALTTILEELDELQFKKLLSYLEKIPQSVKLGKGREEFGPVIIQHLGLEGSITMIHKAMEQIPRRDSAVQVPLRPFVDRMKKMKSSKKMSNLC